MSELFGFGKFGLEDMTQGYGTFGPVTLPDGSSATLNKVGIQSFLGGAYLSAADQAGSTLDAQINNALTALAAASSGGGTIDCRSLYGSQTISSSITFSLNNVTLLFGAVTIAQSAAFILSNGLANLQIKGGGSQGNGATIFNYSGTSGAWVQMASGNVTTGIQIEDVFVSTSSTAAGNGALAIGSPSESYASGANYRTDWVLRNVTFSGPGASNTGLVGVSLVMLGRLLHEHVHIYGYETALVMCGTTDCNGISTTLDSSLYGLVRNTPTGYPNGAASNDKFFGLTIHGPAIGTTGIGLTENLSGTQYFALFIESGVTTATAMVQFGASAFFNQFHAPVFAMSGGTLSTFMVFTAGAAQNEFYGAVLDISSGSTTITMGAPSAGLPANQNAWYGCDENTQIALGTAVAAGYATYFARNAVNNSGFVVAPTLQVTGSFDVTTSAAVGTALTVGTTLAVTTSIAIASGSSLTKYLKFQTTHAVNVAGNGNLIISNISCSGVALGDRVVVTETNAGGINTTMVWSAVVQSANLIQIVGYNVSGTTYNPGTQTFEIAVIN